MLEKDDQQTTIFCPLKTNMVFLQLSLNEQIIIPRLQRVQLEAPILSASVPAWHGSQSVQPLLLRLSRQILDYYF